MTNLHHDGLCPSPASASSFPPSSYPEEGGTGMFSEDASASVAEVPERKRLYIAETTLVERYYYDPSEIVVRFADEWAHWDGTFADFVIEMFTLHVGSQFHDEIFPGDASPEHGVELVERWDDE